MEGRYVDWWFIYKANDGFDFAYRDSNDSSTKTPLQIVPQQLNTTKDYALGSTLHQLYMNKKEYSWVAYNDERPPQYPPDDAASSSGGGAHAKGILVGAEDGGFWLVHSVPKFPDLNAKSFTWDASTIYAQSFLCLSLNATGIDEAALQLQTFHPSIFDSYLNADLEGAYPHMKDLVDGTRHDGDRVAELLVGQTVMTSFAKSNDWGRDLYEDLVSPYFDQGFLWETWRRTPKMESFCAGQDSHEYDARNIEYISFPDSPAFTWHYTKDHAKWGLSTDSDNPLVCVGGINRMYSQRKRGGGTVCVANRGFYNAMHALVQEADDCSDRNDRDDQSQSTRLQLQTASGAGARPLTPPVVAVQ